jgi:hypothetical protein
MKNVLITLCYDEKLDSEFMQKQNDLGLEMLNKLEDVSPLVDFVLLN